MALGITINFAANVAAFNAQLNQIQNHVTQTANGIGDRVGKINGLLGSIGVGISLGGMAAFVKQGIDAADALNDMADRSGIAVEKLAGLKFGVKLADTDMEAFIAGSNKLSIAIAKNAVDFASLGISAKDPADAMLQLSDVFSGIEDPQRRAAFGAAVLGKNYAELAPFLLQGSDAIAKLITEGQKMSGITKEAADEASKFNDMLDAQAFKLNAVATKIAVPVVTSLNNFIDKMKIATETGATFNNVIKGLVNITRGDLQLSGLARELDENSEKIAATRKKIIAMDKNSFLGAAIDKAVGNSIEEENKKLKALKEERKRIYEQIDASNKKTAVPVAAKVSDAAIDKVIGINQDKPEKTGLSKAQQEAKALDDLAKRTIENLQREVALRGDNTELAKIEYEVLHGSLSNIDEKQKLRILQLAAEKHNIELNMATEKKAIELTKEAITLIQNKVKAEDDLRQRLNGRFNAPSVALESGLEDIAQAKKLGIIDEKRARAEQEKLSIAYKESFVDPAMDDTKRLSDFAEQAARNIQDSFATFLFDPFAGGSEKMLQNFLTALRQMAAQAASAAIFDKLLGKKDSSGGLIGEAASGISHYFSGTSANIGGGGVAGAASSGIADFISSFFHEGGVAGYGSRSLSVPASVFHSANRYHNGGLASNEVPAILLKGERVLNLHDTKAFDKLMTAPKSPKFYGGGSQSINNNSKTVQVNIDMRGSNSATAKKDAGRVAYQVGIETQRALNRNG